MDTALLDSETSVNAVDYRSILVRAKAALEAGVEVAVDVGDIRRYEKQPRKYFNPVSLRSLSNSIAAGGQTTPGLIRRNPGPTEYELIDGERRWRSISAIPEGDRPTYKAKLIEADDDVIQFLISGVSNFNREGHTTLETMDTISRLLGWEFPIEEIATILGLSVSWTTQIYGLTKLTAEVQAFLDPELPKAKQLPVTAAIQISKMDPMLQMGVTEMVLARTVTLAALRSKVISVSKSAGAHIRVREVDPRKKFRSFQNKAQLIERIAGDLETMLADPEIRQQIKVRREESVTTKSLLRRTREIILRCEDVLKQQPSAT